MAKRTVTLLLLLVVGAGAFFYFSRDTRHDVVLRHAAEFTVIRQQLTRLAGVIKPPPPPPREIPETGCSGVPAGAGFKYDKDDTAGTNTGLVTYGQLRDPAGPAGKWSVVETELARYVAAVAPGYRPTDADNEWASDEYTRRVEAMAKVRYVVVVWTDPSEGFEQNGPWDDILGIEAHIADLHSGKSICFVHAVGGLRDRHRIHYGHPSDSGPGVRQEHANEAIRQSLRSAATSAFEKKLNSLGHGHFDLETM